MVEPTRKRDLIVTLTKSKVTNKKLEGMGYETPAIVVDGRKGLPKMFPDKKVQLCQFYQKPLILSITPYFSLLLSFFVRIPRSIALLNRQWLTLSARGKKSH